MRVSPKLEEFLRLPASGLSSFGFGGTNAHVTCKSSEEVVETKAGQ